ncbi:MAG: hypothetical protein HZA27_01340 [Candidatus Omnitrophica bacterium]|nr:hypothetical protein [Candidatus Omnitrophota bacterium]
MILPSAQYRWVSQRLGPLCFANASLMLFYLRSMHPEEGTLSKEEHELLRSDRIKILCPRCRREAVLKS